MKKTLIIFVALFFCSKIFSQDELNSSQLFVKGEFCLFNKDYYGAAKIYSTLLQSDSTNKIISYHLALAYLNIPGQNWRALQMFQNVFPKGQKIPDEGKYFIYVGNSKLIEPLSSSRVVIDTVSFKGFKITNPFQPYSNIVISGNGNEMAYVDSHSSANKIYFVVKENGEWKKPIEITSQVASDGSYFPSSISYDGQRMYLSAYDNFESDIYVSIMEGTTWSQKKKMGANVNTNSWEAHAFESPNGQTLYFSSDRPGGFGGMDIYFCNKNGSDWGKAVNAGVRINTFLNDDYPYITNDGQTFIYASQGFKRGKDKYDLYFCHFTGPNAWSAPENLGYPLCTSEDDIFYVPLTGESQAFFNLFLNRERDAFNGFNEAAFIKALNITGRVYAGTNKTDYSDLMIETSVNDSKRPPILMRNNPDGTFKFYFKEGLYQIKYSCPGYVSKIQNIVVPYLFRSDTITINQTLPFGEQNGADSTSFH